MPELTLKIDSRVRKQLRDNANYILQTKEGISLEEFIDRQCFELISLTNIEKLMPRNYAPKATGATPTSNQNHNGGQNQGNKQSQQGEKR